MQRGLRQAFDLRITRTLSISEWSRRWRLPTDILGSSVYNPRDGSFTFRPGPIFTNILLADEINRASPRTG